jgi:hypothetical protein
MFRRRRRVREIPFSFDSFLDIVANVVGIIIRLILVVWVGARSYSSVQPTLKSSRPPPLASGIGPAGDPLQAELEEHRRELAKLQQELLVQLRALQDIQTHESKTKAELHAIVSREDGLNLEERQLSQALEHLTGQSQGAAFSLSELRQRGRQLAEEIRALRDRPTNKRVLHYRTPVSEPLHSEELLFECSGGRVTFIDISALLGEATRGTEEKGKLLRSAWQVQDVTPPAGSFRLHYVIARDRELLDSLGGDAAPSSVGGFRYGLSEWQLEPVTMTRGETLQAALAAGSEFRRIIDGIDPEQTAVTFWVYPDSFEVFRRLRDVLYERNVVVAGRPLPDGVPIASSRRGSLSRGQ